MTNKCARCDIETEDIGDVNTSIYVTNLDTGEKRQAVYLCSECFFQIKNRVDKFLADVPVDLTPAEKKLRDYFND